MLPHNLYTAKATKALDKAAITSKHFNGSNLMNDAGKAVFVHLIQRWPDVKKLIVFCGKGNNGGDGYVVATLAKSAGLIVQVLQVDSPSKMSEEARLAKAACEKSGVSCHNFDAATSLEADVVVDALLGTGLQGAPSKTYLQAIKAINHQPAPILAVDIPSGLEADTGHVAACAVKAETTITFIGLKQGLFTHLGPYHAGKIIFENLNVPTNSYKAILPTAKRLNLSQEKTKIRPRFPHQYKGDFGHLLVVGSAPGYLGASIMCASAALRTGAGLVSVATDSTHAASIPIACPEIMAHGVTHKTIGPLLEKASVIALGPGLGQSTWAEQLVIRLLETDKPLVVDADALNIIAKNPLKKDNWLLTPHPGEAARLLDTTIDDIQKDRFAALNKLQEKYGGVIVLKGCGTLIKTSDNFIHVCTQGNPGMATAGMGDILTGIIASLIGQHLTLDDAATLGVILHASAADAAAKDGMRGLIATDLMPYLRAKIA